MKAANCDNMECLFDRWQEKIVLFITKIDYLQCYRGRLFSVAVARGGRDYGLEYPQETVDWAPRGSWGAELTLSWVCSSR